MPDAVSVVRTTGVYLLDFFYSRMQLYVVLIFVLFPCYILICMYWEMIHGYVRDLSC